MANILVVFFNGIQVDGHPDAMPLFYEGFISGLDREGNSVHVIQHQMFGVDFGSMDEEDKRYIQSLDLDICIIFNNFFYDLSDVVDCPIVIYEVDTPTYFGNKDVLCKNPDRYLFFCAQTDSIQIIQSQFGVPGKNIFLVPPFSDIYADDTPLTTNISFIGTKFASPYLPSRFFADLPSLEDQEIYIKIIEEIQNNPQITMEELSKNYPLTSPILRKNINISSILMWLSAEKRIHVLSAVVDLGLKLYGDKGWKRDFYYDHRLQFAFREDVIYSIEHNQRVLNESKIGISVSHLQATSGFPWRITDIMASNACLVSDYHADLEKYFQGVKIPVYTSVYEAREQCQILLRDESRRRDIVAQCQEVIENKYRFRNLLKAMEEYSGVVMSKLT